ncbi:MAG: hypothetical protein ABI382_08355 [Nakamurella sp.]
MTQPSTPHPALHYDAARRAEERSRAGGPWTVDHLRLCWLVLVAVGIVMTTVAAVVSGYRAFLGGATGIVIVGLFFTFSTLVVAKIGEKAPHMVLAAALGTYVVKIVALGIVIILLPPHGPIAPRWMAIAVVVGLVAWMSAHLRYILVSKVFYVDPL